MIVADNMNSEPQTLREHQSLSDAARIMWEHDCGWVPVVDGSRRIVGVITDRDICMAAYTRGMTLDDMVVAGTMATNVQSVHANDDLRTAYLQMQAHRVRRLPVTDAQGRIVGLLSLSDLARQAKSVDQAAIVATIRAVCEPNGAGPSL